MGWISDVLKGNSHWFKEQGKAIKDNPERLLLGAMTPVGSKVWGKITGKDYKPVMDAWGGPSADVYASGEAKGINMGPAHNTHRIARVVAAMGMAGGAAGGGEGTAAPGGAGGGGSIADAAVNASMESIGTGSMIDMGAATGSAGASGGGAISGLGSGGVTGMGASSGGASWLDQLPTGGGGGGGQRKRVEAPEVAAAQPTESWGQMLERYNANAGPYADGQRIRVDGKTAILEDEQGREIGRAPNDQRLYDAIASMEGGR